MRLEASSCQGSRIAATFSRANSSAKRSASAILIRPIRPLVWGFHRRHAMFECAVCSGRIEPWVVSVTGSWPYVEKVIYGDDVFFVHGAVANPTHTTWWLAPWSLCVPPETGSEGL